MHCKICRCPSYSDPCLPCKVRIKDAKELGEAQRLVTHNPAYDSDLYRCLKVVFESLQAKALNSPGFEAHEWQNLNLGIHAVIAKGIMASTPATLRQLAETISSRPVPAAPAKPKQEPITVTSTQTPRTAPVTAAPVTAAQEPQSELESTIGPAFDGEGNPLQPMQSHS